MSDEDIELLEKHGWEVVCKSPFEIEKEMSTASYEAAELILLQLKHEENDRIQNRVKVLTEKLEELKEEGLLEIFKVGNKETLDKMMDLLRDYPEGFPTREESIGACFTRAKQFPQKSLARKIFEVGWQQCYEWINKKI